MVFVSQQAAAAGRTDGAGAAARPPRMSTLERIAAGDKAAPEIPESAYCAPFWGIEGRARAEDRRRRVTLAALIAMINGALLRAPGRPCCTVLRRALRDARIGAQRIARRRRSLRESARATQYFAHCCVARAQPGRRQRDRARPAA